MRIQHVVDLQGKDCALFKVSSYSDNDQANANAIIEYLEKKDLLIEDLGYFKIDKFEKIQEKEAFFLSRFKPGNCLYKDIKGEKIDLLSLCRSLKKQDVKHYELNCYLGCKNRFKVRAVIIRVPDAVANERRRKAKKDRNKKANHSEAYLEMLDWTILITNLPPLDFNPNELLQLYGLRWRIEIIFKTWKQCMNFEKLLGNKQKVTNPHYVYSIVYFFLLYVTVYILTLSKKWRKIIWEQHQQHMSDLKFIEFLLTKEGENLLLYEKDDQKILNIVSLYCTYERRPDRLNYHEQMELILHEIGAKNKNFK